MGCEWGYGWYGVRVQVVANLEGEQVVLWVQEEVWRFDPIGPEDRQGCHRGFPVAL